ncbi:MAG TPA: trehalose-6-phosphate synthase [Gaiellaceae bacterium]|nr:trehalose-6-phosphate synthase [Gaiellaceae bacterium]
MREQRKLLVVSNRGPVTYGRDANGERTESRGGGGLATALRGLVEQHEVTWIANAMTDEDRVVAGEEQRDTVLLAQDAQAYDLFYNVAANPTLWFVQHMLWNLAFTPDFDQHAWTDGYRLVNANVARAVIEALDRDPTAAVFFQDYHLYLAPAIVRRERPGALMSHFVHIPWPEADAWSVLPPSDRAEVFAGLLANDVVGFHTHRWQRNFLRGCIDVLGADVDGDVVQHDGRVTRVTAHPIGIDPDEFDELRERADVLERERELVASRPEQLIVRVDRTDPSKNIVRGFRAFGLMLERHPELRGRVRMLALLDPSRQDIPEYAEYLAAIEREAAALGDAVDLRIGDDFARSVAAYKQFDVLLVNAVFDGLNLVAKEGAFVNRRDGVLVLTENAGSHEELGEWAVSVNPFDVSAQADALYTALTMNAVEKRRRAEAIHAHVRAHDIEEWGALQMADLDRVRSTV